MKRPRGSSSHLSDRTKPRATRHSHSPARSQAHGATVPCRGSSFDAPTRTPSALPENAQTHLEVLRTAEAGDGRIAGPVVPFSASVLDGVKVVRPRLRLRALHLDSACAPTCLAAKAGWHRYRATSRSSMRREGFVAIHLPLHLTGDVGDRGQSKTSRRRRSRSELTDRLPRPCTDRSTKGCVISAGTSPIHGGMYRPMYLSMYRLHVGCRSRRVSWTPFVARGRRRGDPRRWEHDNRGLVFSAARVRLSGRDRLGFTRPSRRAKTEHRQRSAKPTPESTNDHLNLATIEFVHSRRDHDASPTRDLNPTQELFTHLHHRCRYMARASWRATR